MRAVLGYIYKLLVFNKLFYQGVCPTDTGNL